MGCSKNRSRSSPSTNNCASNRSTSACMSERLLNGWVPLAAGGQSYSSTLQFMEKKNLHWRVSSIALQDHRQGLDRPGCDLCEKLVDGIGNLVQVIIEQVLPGSVRRTDPPASGNVDAAHTLQRNF